MIYLISQMILALAVAIILGMGLGWLVHRTSYNQKIHALKQTVARQHARLGQAQSEVSMLAEDYDEMQRQLQDQITALREENRQIPSLNSNLEKSQLLIKQMMQRHEAKVRELTSEKQKLSSRLAKIDEQEQTRNQLAAGLDKRRRESARNDAPSPLDNQPAKQSGDQSADIMHSAGTGSKDRSEEAVVTTGVHAEKPSSDVVTPIHSASTGESNESEAGKTSRFAAAESDVDPFDEVMEVADELQRELDMTAERKNAAIEMDSSLEVTEAEPRLSVVERNDAQTRTASSPTLPGQGELNLTAVRLDADEKGQSLPLIDLQDLSLDNDDSEDLDNLIALEDVGDFTDMLEPDASDTLSQTNDLDELDSTDGTLDQTNKTSSRDDSTESPDTTFANAETAADDSSVTDDGLDNDALQLDGSSDDATLFDPVTRHDDLQQIFGIGPLTEKALNELGITSYSQLAELKQHDIQRIADALEIGPGRIERDNWVGNARRQLEEVLEQL